ncbi:uncharacterized protein METZ01_LOCUS93728 [marine metagenome]|uniref:Uncharacterized protein n=1 Tax=marine metagenome TaxID=408172 RepID=A0A381VKX0_9ZZZZ
MTPTLLSFTSENPTVVDIALSPSIITFCSGV